MEFNSVLNSIKGQILDKISIKSSELLKPVKGFQSHTAVFFDSVITCTVTEQSDWMWLYNISAASAVVPAVLASPTVHVMWC